MSLGLGDYVKAAFNARPIGMFVPPNWIGLAAFALLGLANPGFWVLGAGLEIAYLTALSTNPRFQRTVAASRSSERQRDSQAQLDGLVARLTGEHRQRYRALQERCRTIVDAQHHGAAIVPGLEAQQDGLGRLLFMYLRLLLARQAMARVLAEEGRGQALQERVEELRRQIADARVGDDLRRSLSGQVELLEQRLAGRREARQKLAYIDAELRRIEEQVELIREQAVLTTDPAVLSARIDAIAATLGGTSDWIREQQRVFGSMEDLLMDPPPLAAPRASERE